MTFSVLAVKKLVGVGETYEQKQPSNGSSNFTKARKPSTPIQLPICRLTMLIVQPPHYSIHEKLFVWWHTH
jgi:hypothetical protein